MDRPNCMNCGKPLAKQTRSIFFRSPTSQGGAVDDIRADCRTKEDAQRHTNLEVVSVKRGHDGSIRAAGIWDGKSWGLMGQGLFCTGSCAQAYGTRAARKAKGIAA